MADTLKVIASSTAKIRELLAESKKDLHKIQLLLNALDDGLRSLWPFQESEIAGNDIADASTSVITSLASNASLWKETVGLVASGRIVSIAAQADEALAGGSGVSGNEDARHRVWFGDGRMYSRWIGRGAVWMLEDAGRKRQDSIALDGQKAAADMLGKAMTIGYRDDLVEEVTRLMVFEDTASVTKYRGLMASLKPWEQTHFLNSLLRWLAKLLEKEHLATSSTGASKDVMAVSAVAALLQFIVEHLPGLQSHLVAAVVSNPQNELISRAVVAALPVSARIQVLEKVWSQFSDPLQIRHTPILVQEATTRVLLIAAGYVHRAEPLKVLNLARGSGHNKAISEHLKNSSERVRWLGMCAGMAISSLVDDEDKRMDFKIDDLQSEESTRFRTLTSVNDERGDMEALQGLFGSQGPQRKPKHSPAIVAQSKSTIKQSPLRPVTTGKIIEVIDDSADEEDEDLKPYAKPDDDEPDSDEDATLVNRNKPKAPVYIRDLISCLSDTENRERHILALQTAPLLIRRKATFGNELHDRVPEIAQVLVSLQDNFKTDDFYELKQDALAALTVAEPKTVGPLMTKMLFESDLSISQRIAIIVALGVGGRELAGFKDESLRNQTQSNETQQKLEASQQSWPSKMLPANLHELYSNTPNIQSLVSSKNLVQNASTPRPELLGAQKIDTLARTLEGTMLNPVSTREWSKKRPRTKLLKNNLTSVVADYFFFPLTRYWQAYSQSSTARDRNPLNEPSLTALALKTLTLLLLAAGPSAPSLPTTSKEMFALLLSLRVNATRHKPVMEGVLFALVALLDLHGIGSNDGPGPDASVAGGARWLAEECGKEIVEFREWTGAVWESIEKDGGFTLNLGDKGGGKDHGGDDETNRCRVLAAKALVSINEVVEKYQRLLVGELSRM